MTTASETPTPVICAAGGTGGHIAPLLAIVERMREALGATPPVRFVCSERPIDARVLEPAVSSGLIRGYRPIPARHFAPNPRAVLGLVARWGGCVRAARSVIRDAIADTGATPVVLTTGGFVAPPSMHAARLHRCPRVVVSLDAVQGRAMRLIARNADLRLDAASDAFERQRSGWSAIPPLVRRGAMPNISRQDARERFDLDRDRPTLLVMGGSQGARSVNDFIAAHLAHDPDAWRDHGWQAIHLAGEGAVERIGAAYEKASVRARVLPFTDDIGAAWSAATLHVGRAGAGAVAEAQVAGVPSLFFPYPFHKDRHQAHNAQPLVARGQARILDDQRTAEANLACHGSDFSESLRANAVAPPRDIRSIEDGARGAIDTLVKQGYLASCYLEPGAPQSERFIQTPS